MCKNSNTSCLLQITLETLKTALKDDDAFLSFINKPTVPKSYTALHYVSANCTINEINPLTLHLCYVIMTLVYSVYLLFVSRKEK